MSAVRRIGETSDILGEGPVWDVAEQAFYWVDIRGRAVRRVRFGARAAVAAAVMLVCLSARAADSIGKETGARLLARCEPALELVAGSTGSLSRARHADAMSCIGFVDGFLWGHGWAAWRQNRDMYYCPPEDLSGQRAVPTLVDYLRAHPERLDAPAHVLLFSALSKAYPCRPLPDQK